MAKTNLRDLADRLPEAWRSTIVGRPGASQLKVVRMDGRPYPNEIHTFDEALLVLEGSMKLEIDGTQVEVNSGEVYVVPAGRAHSVAAGSHGTLLIIDAAD